MYILPVCVVARCVAVTMTTSSSSGGPGGPGRDLLEFLKDAELEDYHSAILTQLRVTAVSQFKYVEDEDLSELGMTRPEIRRRKKFFKKECPQGAFGKIKKVGRQINCLSLWQPD